jgi:hypothetical protein
MKRLHLPRLDLLVSAAPNPTPAENDSEKFRGSTIMKQEEAPGKGGVRSGPRDHRDTGKSNIISE